MIQRFQWLILKQSFILEHFIREITFKLFQITDRFPPLPSFSAHSYNSRPLASWYVDTRCSPCTHCSRRTARLTPIFCNPDAESCHHNWLAPEFRSLNVFLLQFYSFTVSQPLAEGATHVTEVTGLIPPRSVWFRAVADFALDTSLESGAAPL